jgi:endonuclease/exonuclease/phosphatase family metal-dependent hydrolase
MSLPLRIASYNVHSFIGRGNRYDPECTLAVIAELGSDVVALQEVAADDRDGLTMLQTFAAARDYQLIFGPTLLRQSGQHYGNALLVRGNCRQSHLHDISVSQREPRGVIETVVEFAGEPWQFVATHLGLSPYERRRQVEALLDLITVEDYKNTVLMGDLNEWFTWGRPLRWLKSYFHIGHARATFPARFPVFALDRIWVHPHQRISKAFVFKSKQSRIASDHLPIIVEVN